MKSCLSYFLEGSEWGEFSDLNELLRAPEQDLKIPLFWNEWYQPTTLKKRAVNIWVFSSEKNQHLRVSLSRFCSGFYSIKLKTGKSLFKHASVMFGLNCNFPPVLGHIPNSSRPAQCCIPSHLMLEGVAQHQAPQSSTVLQLGAGVSPWRMF